MLNKELTPLLRAQVGIRQDVEGPALDAELAKLAGAKLTLDQAHELLTLKTLKLVGPETGDSIQFGNWLGRSIDDAVKALLDTLEVRLTEAGLTPQLLQPKVAFTPPIGRGLPIVPQSRNVGLVIQPAQDSIVVMVRKLQFWGVFADGFKLVLTDQETGQATDIIPAKNNGWVDLDIPLLPGHTYQLLYAEDDLGQDGIAFNTVTKWPRGHTGGCKGCGVPCVSSFAQITGIMSDPTTPFTATYGFTSNYGINLVLSAAGDTSVKFLDDPSRLFNALKQQVAYTFLSKIAYSRRKNGVTEESKNAALYALNDSENSGRVSLALDKALGAIVKALVAESAGKLDVDNRQLPQWGTL